MDNFGLRAVSGLQIGIRRVQRQMVCWAEGVAWRVVRHAADSHSINLSKFLSSARAVDDFGVPLREDSLSFERRQFSGGTRWHLVPHQEARRWRNGLLSLATRRSNFARGI